jgi:hypothetical protein
LSNSFNNFIIVGTQRTGSTALFRALNFHPEVACGSEWTQDVPAHRKLAVTERAIAGDFSVLPKLQRVRIERVFSPSTRWLGFKLLFRSSGLWLLHPRFAPALRLDRFGAYLRWIAGRPDLRVIHITRESPIEWLKSKYVADKSRAFAGRAYPDDITVEIPVGEALRRLAAKRWIDDCLAALSTTNPYLRISYEDFLESDRAIVAKMMNFLGCDPGKLHDFDYRKQRKQSGRSARDYVSNFEPLVAALKQNRFI